MPTNTICLKSPIAIPSKAYGIAFRSQSPFLALVFVWLGGGLTSRCVVVAIHFRFSVSSSSFSSRSTTATSPPQHHQHASAIFSIISFISHTSPVSCSVSPAHRQCLLYNQ
jgi:hypothetical protein